MLSNQHFKLCIYAIKLGTVICRTKKNNYSPIPIGCYYLCTTNDVFLSYMHVSESKENGQRY